MLILKNLTESSGVLYEKFIGSPFSLSPSLLSRPYRSSLAREPLNFVNLAKYIQERTACFIQSQGSECALTIFAASICKVILFWAFGFPRSSLLQFVFFFFFFSRPTMRCRFYPALCAALRETA